MHDICRRDPHHLARIQRLKRSYGDFLVPGSIPAKPSHLFVLVGSVGMKPSPIGTARQDMQTPGACHTGSSDGCGVMSVCKAGVVVGAELSSVWATRRVGCRAYGSRYWRVERRGASTLLLGGCCCIYGGQVFMKRRWFSGKISRCHRDAPGSIPGRRTLLCPAWLRRPSLITRPEALLLLY